MGCRDHFGPQAEFSGWNTGVMFVIKVHCIIHVTLTGLEFSFPLAAPFFTGTGRELKSIGWCYNNAGQGLTPLFREKGDFFWVPKPGFNLHTVDTCGTHLTDHFITIMQQWKLSLTELSHLN